MRKLNISGLVKKCKELWNNILEIKEILEEDIDTDEFPTEMSAAVEPAIVVENQEQGNESQPDEIFSLNELKDLFDSYVGVVVVGFLSYKSDIPDIEAKIQGSYISDVEIRGQDLYVKLSTLTNKHGGYIKISPSIDGQFAEKGSKDEPTKLSRYRIVLFGEDSIEYIDKNNLGQISYFAGYL